MGMRNSGIYGKTNLAQPRTLSAGSANAGYASGGTSSYPVTGFPASAYLGNNRRVGGGQNSSASSVSSALGNIQTLDSKHVILVLLVIGGLGYWLWHLDNKR